MSELGMCKMCKHYRANLDAHMKGSAHGTCWRYPPTLFLTPSGPDIMMNSDYPPVKANQTCGEFAPKLS